MKTILLLNASPRREKSVTLKLTNRFIVGMQQTDANINIEQINLRDQEINNCIGCLNCWKKTPGHCIQEDDMAKLLAKYEQADLTIWSMPIYSFGMPAIAKTFLERCMPLIEPAVEMQADGSCTHPARNPQYRKNKYIVIASCGFPNTIYNHEAFIQHFDILFRDRYEKIICTEAPLFSMPQYQKTSEQYLQKVEQAGSEYALTGKISSQLSTELVQPMIPAAEFIAAVNGFWTHVLKKVNQ